MKIETVKYFVQLVLAQAFLNPIALRKVKVIYNFGLLSAIGVKKYIFIWHYCVGFEKVFIVVLHLHCITRPFEPHHVILHNLELVTSKGYDQTALECSLIKAFTCHISHLWNLPKPYSQQ